VRARIALALAFASSVGRAQVPAPEPVPPSTPSPVAPLPSAAPAPPPAVLAPSSASPSVAVFPVHVAAGLDPSLAELVGRKLGQSARALGYSLVDALVTARAASGSSGALTPERAGELVRQTGAVHGLFASVWAEGGSYRVSIQLTPRSGAPRVGSASGVSSDLYASVDAAVRSLLPLASAPAAVVPPPTAPSPAAPGPPPAAPEEPFPEGRFRLALGGEAAFGFSPGPFRNYLAGARFDRRFRDDVSMGLGVYYANLKGKDGRAHNVLPWALFEYRIDLGADWAVPLRFASGYLPKNGPVVKVAAGVSLPLGQDLELSTELLNLTTWVTHERAVVSADVAAELGITF